MAEDSVTLDLGSGGDAVAIDKISGKDYQRVKLTDGTTDGTAGIPGDATNGLFVNVKAQAAPSSLPLPAGAATSAKQPALGTAGSASTDVITVQGIASGTPQPVSGTVTATGPLTDTQLRATAVPVSLATAPALVASTANIGFVTPAPSTTGGWTPKIFTALTNTKTLINGAACTFGGYMTIYNPNAAAAYVQVFDAATTGAVTLGTTAPTVILPIPAGSAANCEASLGVHMASGIVIAITTTATGSTALGTGCDGTLLFK